MTKSPLPSGNTTASERTGSLRPPVPRTAFLASLLVMGASGIIAQIVLLRELLVSFLGNELVLGIILAN